MLRYVALVRTNVSEELSATIIRVTRIDELGTTLALTSDRRTLRRNTLIEAISSSETSVLTRATRRNIAEDAILHAPRLLTGQDFWLLIKGEGVSFLEIRMISYLKRRNRHLARGQTFCLELEKDKCGNPSVE
jgi:hypothetical protein